MDETIRAIDLSIDSLIILGAQDVFTALATPSANLLVLIAGVALSLFAARCLFRRSMAIDDFLAFVARFALIYSLVSGGALWASYVYPFISGFGEAVGSAILAGFTGGVYSSDGLVESFAEFVALNFETIGAAFGVVSLSNLADGSGIFIVLTGLIALAAVLVLAGLAFAFILISKVFLGVLIAIAPVMLVGMFLKSTSDIANGWVRGISLILIFQLLVYGVLGMSMAATIGVLNIVDSGITEIGAENPQFVAAELSRLSLVSMLSAACVFMCPMFARAVGGANIGFGENKIGPAAAAAAAATTAAVSAVMNSGNDTIGGASNAQEAASSSAQTSDPDYRQQDRDRGRATAARHTNASNR